MNCPVCQTPNPEDAATCFQCGLEFPPLPWHRRKIWGRIYPATLLWIIGLSFPVIAFGMFFLVQLSLMRSQPRIPLGENGAQLANMTYLRTMLAQHMAEDGRGFPVICKDQDYSGENGMRPYLVRELNRLRNPVNPELPAWTVSFRDPPFWPLVKAGQMVYVQLDIRDGAAQSFVIYGMGSKKPIKTVLRGGTDPYQTPEDPRGRQMEHGF
jgi:hypothetical protein